MTKYADKLDFFKLATMQGVKVSAYDSLPHIPADQTFYLDAYNVLSGAGYADISAYCKDHGLTIDERADLISVITALRAHQRKAREAD